MGVLGREHDGHRVQQVSRPLGDGSHVSVLPVIRPDEVSHDPTPRDKFRG